MILDILLLQLLRRVHFAVIFEKEHCGQLRLPQQNIPLQFFHPPFDLLHQLPLLLCGQLANDQYLLALGLVPQSELAVLGEVPLEDASTGAQNARDCDLRRLDAADELDYALLEGLSLRRFSPFERGLLGGDAEALGVVVESADVELLYRRNGLFLHDQLWLCVGQVDGA